jgi:hypothetical protein
MRFAIVPALACVIHFGGQAAVSGGKNSSFDRAGFITVTRGFEENKGQVTTTAGDPAPIVRFRLRDGNTNVFLLGNGIAYQFNKAHYPARPAGQERDGSNWPGGMRLHGAMRMQPFWETYRMDVILEGADTNACITTDHRSLDFTQYYNHGALEVHTYTDVTYHEVYPGIDWVVHATAEGMEYDFVLHPGANPGSIKLRFKDFEELRVDAAGRLIHGNCMGRFIEDPPVSMQNGRGVSSRFKLVGDLLMFELGTYDPRKTLIIDPSRIWATYYGGAGWDMANSTTVDSGGNVFIAGDAESFAAIASGGHQNTLGGSTDSFLVKFNANGERQWGTYYGGTGNDVGASCAVDAAGNVFLAGSTGSNNAIASSGFQSTIGGGEGILTDGFLVKFNTDGVRQWATYYGGPGDDNAVSCAVDGDGSIYLAGTTASTSAIAYGGEQNTFGGGDLDAFLVKFNTNGARLWATYYGGIGVDGVESCAVNGDGNLYMAGWTSSITAIANNGHQNSFGGGNYDAFLISFNSDGIRQWGTYYGGAADDIGTACVVDDSANVYMVGGTASTTGIAFQGYQGALGGGEGDSYLVKFKASGVRAWGTYYGGTSNESPSSITLDGMGNVFIAGATTGDDAIALNGNQNTFGGGLYDGFLVEFDRNGVPQWGTLYGGTGEDFATSCASDGGGSVYMAGYTESDTGMAYQGHQNTFAGNPGDGFLVKFATGSSPNGISSQESPMPAVAVWPNPGHGDHFFLRIPGTRGEVDLRVFDSLGRLRLSRQLRLMPGRASVEVDFGSDLANGLYLVRVAMNGRSKTIPLMIE